MSIANYAENAILDACFNSTALDVTAPYVKLHTGDPGEACTSNAAVEDTRIIASFGAAASGVVASDTTISWSSVATTETISHVSIWDAETAGNALWFGALNASRALIAGDDLVISTGDLTVTLD